MQFTSSALPFILRDALVPLMMVALCGVAAVQQRSRPLRTLMWAALASAAAVPLLMLGLPGPAWTAACVLFLLSASLYWLACADMMLQRRNPFWMLAAPGAWLAFFLLVRMLPGSDDNTSSLIGILSCLVVSDVTMLLCLPPLLSVARRSLSHSCLIGAVVLGPVVSCLCAAGLVMRGASFAGSIGWTVVPMITCFAVLWPGLAMLTLTDMATSRERRLALQDDLSGLLNRRGFFRRVAPMSDRTLLLFDIDHFKRINDTYGHAAGDAAIRRFAQVLSDLSGDNAVIGRVGGEEFAVALNRTRRNQAVVIADRIRLAYADAEQAFATGVTVSIGIALPSAAPISVGDQMAAADRALYRAKKSGRNRVEVEGRVAVIGYNTP